MKVWTIQVAQWREADRQKIPFLDTTFKSGDPVFAPPKKLVLAYKAGEITEAEYTQSYTGCMRESYRNNQARWIEVCNMEEVAIACYCSADKFCHRHILVNFLIKVCESLGIEVQRMGEIRRQK
jgi:uncharacterized protein YeaO (DUF488 family)